MAYDNLLRQAAQQGIDVYEKPMNSSIKGLYSDNVIWINRVIPSRTEKACILAEELGHHHTNTGNILDQRQLSNRKQERGARAWAYQKLVPLNAFVQAHKAGERNRFELAERLGVTEDFLDSAIRYYQEKYGLFAAVDDFHTVCFDPLGVIEMFAAELLH